MSSLAGVSPPASSASPHPVFPRLLFTDSQLLRLYPTAYTNSHNLSSQSKNKTILFVSFCWIFIFQLLVSPQANPRRRTYVFLKAQKAALRAENPQGGNHSEKVRRLLFRTGRTAFAAGGHRPSRALTKLRWRNSPPASPPGGSASRNRPPAAAVQRSGACRCSCTPWHVHEPRYRG